MNWPIIILTFLFAFSCSKETNEYKVKKMYREVMQDFREVPEIKISELNSKTVLVDVRSKKETNISIIPGAITKEDFEKEKEQFRGKKIAVYCTIGYRSARYTKKLKAENYDAYNLEGSILGWVHSGKSVVDLKGKKVKKVHVYGKTWDLLPMDYKSTY